MTAAVTDSVVSQRLLELAAEFDVDFHREKRHMFREAWSLMRDHFYDPEFHGADWSGLFLQFLPAILGAQQRYIEKA